MMPQVRPRACADRVDDPENGAGDTRLRRRPIRGRPTVTDRQKTLRIQSQDLSLHPPSGSMSMLPLPSSHNVMWSPLGRIWFSHPSSPLAAAGDAVTTAAVIPTPVASAIATPNGAVKK